MIGRKIIGQISASLLLSFSAALAFGQCNCPPASACKPCSGGYTSLTLRYNGPTTALVVAFDNEYVLANFMLSPSQEFTITGSKRNEKFADKLVPVVVNGLVNTFIGPSCTDVSVGATYGNFTVISAVTLGGNIVCCTTVAPDAAAPLFTSVPGPITTSTTNRCDAQVTWIEPVASDNCLIRSITSSHKPGDLFPVGTTEVTYTAVDETGLSSSTSFNVVVTDLQPPVFSNGPTENIIVPADDSCSAIAFWADPQVFDNCSVVVTQSHKPNDRFNLGTTEVLYRATDAAGNTSTFSFNVIVEDRNKPAFTSFPENITATLGTECSVAISWNAPTASDGCSSVSITSSHKAGHEFFPGTTVVRYVVSDQYGNETAKEFTITVKDERTLTIVDCPSDIVVKTEEAFPVSVSWIEPSTPIACENVTLESNFQPESTFPIGTTTVEYLAYTASGKTTSCSFEVVIVHEEKQIHVTKLMTPDGDGQNDEWIIGNIEEFHNTKVVIVDRWGGIIFEASGYDNNKIVWRGHGRSGSLAPSGTYFYSVVATNDKKRIQESGAIELVR
jgi:large repetitive protein